MINLKNPIKVYAAHSKDEKINNICTSGGITYEIEKYFIENGGIVWAVKSNGFNLDYVKCTKIDDLKETIGSKYFQAKTGNAFSEIKDELKSNQKVLFIGTPCLVGGLVKFLDNENTENLFLIDLVCHGTPSKKVFEEYSKFELKDNFDKVTKITFRDKKDYVIKYFNNDKIIKSIEHKQSYYLVAFLDGIIQNEGCYNCNYAKCQRVGDITLGDFWGLSNECKLSKNQNGINLTLINSNKGENLFKNIKNNIEFEERTLEEAIEANHQLSSSILDNEYSVKFRRLLKENDVMFALTHYDVNKTKKINMRKAINKNKTISKIAKKTPILKDKL